jgi:hypothetical protein
MTDRKQVAVGREQIRNFHPSSSKGIPVVTSYLKIALRNLKKNKVHSAINIAGLSVGIACCILILQWVRDELSYDRFHPQAGLLYRVNWDVKTAEGSARVHPRRLLQRSLRKSRELRQQQDSAICLPR